MSFIFLCKFWLPGSGDAFEFVLKADPPESFGIRYKLSGFGPASSSIYSSMAESAFASFGSSLKARLFAPRGT